MSNQISNILIVKLSAIGDVIHALPVAHALKTCYPSAKITWVVEKNAYDILTNNPDIDEVLIFDKPKFKNLTGIIQNGTLLSRELKSRQFDLALDLQGLFKSAAVVWLSGASQRYVYQNAREGSNILAKKVVGPHRNGHVVEQYLDVVRELGCSVQKTVFSITITEAEKRSAQRIAGSCGLDTDKPYVILTPGANWPNKRWPVGKFAALAKWLVQNGYIAVVIGGPGDANMARQICREVATGIIDLTGKTSLKELAWLIQQGKAFVGGDTGPMHLAAAIGKPVVALYGPTDIIRNGPYGNKHIALVAEHECAGCWKRTCSKGLDCLDAISEDQVIAAIKKIMENTK